MHRRRPGTALAVRQVQASDLGAIIALDARVTELPKDAYWREIFASYGQRGLKDRYFLVAESRDDAGASTVVGFIVGEVRAWEFGSAPCGWVFALSVEPEMRLRGVGEALLEAIETEFRKSGVSKMRTMVAKESRLTLLFFRGEGMIAGPYLQLEKDLE